MKTVKELREGLTGATRMQIQKTLDASMRANPGWTIAQHVAHVEKSHNVKNVKLHSYGSTHGSVSDHAHTVIHFSESVETYLDEPRVARLNAILTELTSKLFLNLNVYIEAVRAALDFHGFKLDHLQQEPETQGPSVGSSYGDLIHGPGFEVNRNVQTIPQDFEYVFALKYGDITGGKCPELYLYMCADHIQVEGGRSYWETYAQVVTSDELSELLEDGGEEPSPKVNGLSPESDGNQE